MKNPSTSYKIDYEDEDIHNMIKKIPEIVAAYDINEDLIK